MKKKVVSWKLHVLDRQDISLGFKPKAISTILVLCRDAAIAQNLCHNVNNIRVL